MSGNGLPQNVYTFLLEHIDSLEQLEVMLLLREQRRPWNAAEVARELRIQKESAQNRLSNLANRGIVNEAGGDRFQFAPRTPELEKDIGDLAAAYREWRVTIVNLIATKHLERIKSFADAFKFKGGGK